MWHNEGIGKALNKSRNEKLILMVYLEGENDASKEMANQFEQMMQDEITKTILQKTIALKLVENSDESRMFHSVYPIKPSPSVYLISYTGKLIESFTNNLDKDLFLKYINDAEQDQLKESNSNDIQTSSSKLKNENQSTTKSNESKLDQATLNQKTKELLEKVKEKNKRTEFDRAKNQEMERIRSGKEIQKLRKEHEEKELEELEKQRKKDAVLDKIERERILKRIEEDQQEKKAYFERERLKREEEYNEYQKQQANKSTLINRAIKLEENEIKVQFKLSTGQLICKFKINDTLQTAVDYIKENSDLKNFYFALAYPKKNFDQSSFNSTFSDLGIKNSIVLLVVEDERHTSTNSRAIIQNSFMNQIWNLILSVYTFIFTLISGLFSSIFGGTNRNQSSTSPSTDNQQPPNRFDSRKRGFRSNADPDDNNTYNGNSTQMQQ